MKAFNKNIIIIKVIFLLVLSLVVPSVVFCDESSTQRAVTYELTRNYKSNGWDTLSFETRDADSVIIRHEDYKSKLTEGSLLSALGVILEPDTVNILQLAGFKKGIFIDGEAREYPFEISTKYYNEFQARINKQSGGR
jgi:hypothetical protein